MKSEKNSLTMSVPDAGKMLGICRNASYEAVKRGEIPVIKIGKRLLVPTAALNRLLQGKRETEAS
jgi:excisionase family DNA binding protein